MTTDPIDRPESRPVEAGSAFGFAPDEVLTGEPTSRAPLRWVVVLADDIEPGQAANATACVSAAIAASAANILGPDGRDADGSVHPGLPWAGCAVLRTNPARLRRIREAALRRGSVLVVGMPIAAQTNRVYDDYLRLLAETPSEAVDYAAVSLLGPRKEVGKLVGSLALA